ncbi:DUF6890 family protein [Microbulbifer thermotolerans]|uniref:DUF6890 family protein n=1 Tax=Microbulbifer thermotolerans TaxID=252514 RepID=UPI00396A22E1
MDGSLQPRFADRGKKAERLAERITENAYSQLCAYADKWLPGAEKDEDTLGTALFLERDYWRNFETAVANGIGKAWKS